MFSRKILSTAFGVFVTAALIGCGPSDQDLQDRVNEKLHEQAHLSAVTAHVESAIATLTGTVDSQGDKESAEAIAGAVRGIDSVRSNISLKINSDVVHPVPPPGSGLLSDESLMDSVKLILGHYPLVNASVASGTITLTGSLNQEQRGDLMQKLRDLQPTSINDQTELR